MAMDHSKGIHLRYIEHVCKKDIIVTHIFHSYIKILSAKQRSNWNRFYIVFEMTRSQGLNPGPQALKAAAFQTELLS